MKRLLVIVLALIMLFAPAVSCSQSREVKPESTDEQLSEGTESNTTRRRFTLGDLPTPNEKYTVVFTKFNGLNPIAKSIEAGFIQAAADAGIELIIYDNELNPVIIKSNVDMAIRRGDVDFYVIYTNAVEYNPEIADKLQAAGIPFGAIGTPAIASDGYEAPQMFVFEDEYQSAFMAAESAMIAAQEKGWIEEDIMFLSMGFIEGGMSFLRHAGAAKDGALSVFPNLENLNQFIETSSTGIPDVAAHRTADILSALPADKKLVAWVHSDLIAASMIAEIRAAGRQNDALIVSNALDVRMLEMIRETDAIIVGSADFGYQFWGWIFMEHIINLLNDGIEIPAVINAPFSLVTPENVNDRYDANGESIAHWTEITGNK